jgi:hypothetical protein
MSMIHMHVFYTRHGSSEFIFSVFGLFMHPSGTVSVNLYLSDPTSPHLHEVGYSCSESGGASSSKGWKVKCREVG